MTNEYDKFFKEASETYGVDFHLLKAVGMTESSLNPTAESKSGAKGIMQIMPGTFKSLSDGDIWDPQTNINAGAKYLSQLLSESGGDVDMALAGYNAGFANAKKNGKEKYASYYNKVHEYLDALGGYAGSNPTLSDTDYTPVYRKLPLPARIMVFAFVIVLILAGLAFLGLSVGMDGFIDMKKLTGKG